MLNYFDELLINNDIICADVLAVFERDLDAEFVELGLLICVEASMFEGCVVLLELSEKTVGHLFIKLYYPPYL